MIDFPKVRWLAALLMVAFGVVYEGLDFDLAEALSSPGLQATGIGAGLLAICKFVEEAMRGIDDDDRDIDDDDRGIDDDDRGIEQPGFWRRVL